MDIDTIHEILNDIVDEDNDFINKHKKRREKGDKR